MALIYTPRLQSPREGSKILGEMHLIWRRIRVTRWMGSNAYLLVDPKTREAAVVDPGGRPARLLRLLHHLKVQRVRYILLTHGHIDHIGAVRVLHENTGAPVLLHEAEVPLYRSPWRNFSAFLLRPLVPPGPHGLLQDGMFLPLGNAGLVVLHTPGHTPGSVCFYGGDLLITGDTLFLKSVGNTWLPGGSARQLLQSLKNRILTLPGDPWVLPGHGRVARLSVVKTLNRTLRQALVHSPP